MIRHAIRAANQSLYYYKVGAVITKGSRVLAVGHNRIAHSVLNTKYNNSVHAEMDVIFKMLKRPDGLSSLAGATLYVARLSRGGKLGMAKPCPICQELLSPLKLKQVIYTTPQGLERL